MPDWLVLTPRPMASVLASTQTQSPPSTVPGCVDAAEDRNAHAAVGFLVHAGLRTAQRLAHGQDDRAVIGHQGRVMREDGIGKAVIRFRQPFDLGAGSGDKVGECAVLESGARRIETGSIVPLRSLGAAHGACGGAHQDAFQGRGHRLRAERSLHLDIHLVASRHAQKMPITMPIRRSQGPQIAG